MELEEHRQLNEAKSVSWRVLFLFLELCNNSAYAQWVDEFQEKKLPKTSLDA